MPFVVTYRLASIYWRADFTPATMMCMFTSSTVSKYKPITATDTDTAVLNDITHFNLKF